jgi:drug/metabolite transporter (DMT)-like permease
MTFSRRASGYLFLSLAMIGVGSTVVASKIIGASISPFTATALRFAISSPVFLLLFRWTGEPWPILKKRDLLLTLIQAAAGSVGYTVLMILGLRFTRAADAGVLAGALPAVATAMSVVLLGERADARSLVSIGLAMTGVVAITFQVRDGSMVPLTGRTLVGDALILGAVVCEALFLLLNRKLRSPVSPLALSTLMSVFGLAISIAPAAAELWARGAITIPPIALLGVVYYALGPTVLGFTLWYKGAQRTSGAEAALFTALLPVSALLLAHCVLGEAIRPQQAIGAVLVIGAIAVGVVGRRGESTDVEPLSPSVLSTSE